MGKIINRFSLLIAITLVFALSACGGTSTSTPPITSPAATASTSQTTGPSGVPALSSTAAVTTAGQLATPGKTVFATRCSGCHGDQGQGRTAPAVIGTGANLAKYSNAGGFYRFISTSMPGNAPASLSAQDYLSVTSYILVQNNLVKSETPVSAGQLDNIKLQ